MTNLAQSGQGNGRGELAERRSRPTGLFDPFDLFRNFYSPLMTPESYLAQGIDVRSTDAGYEVEVAVPGYKPDQIEVTYKDGVLSIAGRGERRSFTRSLALPEEVDADKVDARVEHGMLTLALPRRPELQPKRIEIKGAE
jgi:HSP20 family protein